MLARIAELEDELAALQKQHDGLASWANAKCDGLSAELAALREQEPSEVESECYRYRHLYEAESRIRKAQDKNLAALKALKVCGSCMWCVIREVTKDEHRMYTVSSVVAGCIVQGAPPATLLADHCHFTPSRWEARP
jgi:hypothetical protein